MNLLEAMRVYVRVVERGNISNAARDLSLGQPAVSERIDRLEQHLGCRLLMRSTRAFKCTPEGEIFYGWSIKLLEAAEQAIAEVTHGKHLLKGTVRICAPHCIGETLMPELMKHVYRDYPALNLDLVLNDRIFDLVTEGVDIAFRVGKLGEGAFIAYPLGSVERLLVATPELLAGREAILSPADMATQPFLRVKGYFDSEELPLEDMAGHIETLPVRTAMTTSHWRPMYEMILAGVGMGVVPASACVEAIRSGELVRVLSSHRVPPLELNMLIQPQRPFSPRVRALLELFKTLVPTILQRGA